MESLDSYSPGDSRNGDLGNAREMWASPTGALWNLERRGQSIFELDESWHKAVRLRAEDMKIDGQVPLAFPLLRLLLLTSSCPVLSCPVLLSSSPSLVLLYICLFIHPSSSTPLLIPGSRMILPRRLPSSCAMWWTVWRRSLGRRCCPPPTGSRGLRKPGEPLLVSCTATTSAEGEAGGALSQTAATSRTRTRFTARTRSRGCWRGRQAPTCSRRMSRR
eukprot:754566-Hanusia_phi.AAC.1